MTDAPSPRAMRESLAADPFRPLYHFLAPANWMNDPNGAIFWQGRYHLFYQYNPYGAFHGTIHWGHASSEDLVHWTDHPIALAPDPDGPDRDGCWSGGALDDDGAPRFIYFGLPDGNCIASSDDDMLLQWRKSPHNPVVPSPPEGQEEWRAHDPCIWKRDDVYYSLSGSHFGPSREPGGSRDAAFLFRSDDLANWEYMGPFYEPGGESDCAVPDFFALGSKHVMLFASHHRGGQYYVGRYEGDRFVREVHDRMNWPGFDRVPGGLVCSGDLIAPISWENPPGRRTMVAWIAEGRTRECQEASGWAGIMTVPRVLSLRQDGGLAFEPAPELQALRGNERQVTDLALMQDATTPVEGVRGNCMELEVMLDPGSCRELGLGVCRSPGGDEETVITCDGEHHRLTLDVSRASLSDEMVGGEPQTCTLAPASDGLLHLTVLLDRSVVEVFANGSQCLTKRIYPSRGDSTGVTAFARGGPARLLSLTAWDMTPIWPAT